MIAYLSVYMGYRDGKYQVVVTATEGEIHPEHGLPWRLQRGRVVARSRVEVPPGPFADLHTEAAAMLAGLFRDGAGPRSSLPSPEMGTLGPSLGGNRALQSNRAAAAKSTAPSEARDD